MRISDWSSDVCSSDLLLLDRSVGDGVVDARQVLEDDAAGAEVHVTDLGIAHLPLRQADMLLRRIHQTGRPAPAQAVEHRRVRERHRVVVAGVTLAPAVHDAQQHRSEEHTSELQSLMRTSYALFCLQKKPNLPVM